MSAQEAHDTVWYRFALYTAKKLEDGPIPLLVNSMISLNLDIMLGGEE